MKSIVQINDDRCFVCQCAFGSQTHHIFPGNPNRHHSDDDGLTIRICPDCHYALHCGKNSGELMDKYQRLGQRKWEAYFGPALIMEGKDPRSEFRKRYGKNWLEE